MNEAKALLTKAAKLMENYSNEKRHPIVIENNSDIQALAFGAYEFAKIDNINGLRAMAELLFALGYEAGKSHIEVDRSIWNNND